MEKTLAEEIMKEIEKNIKLEPINTKSAKETDSDNMTTLHDKYHLESKEETNNNYYQDMYRNSRENIRHIINQSRREHIELNRENRMYHIINIGFAMIFLMLVLSFSVAHYTYEFLTVEQYLHITLNVFVFFCVVEGFVMFAYSNYINVVNDRYVSLMNGICEEIDDSDSEEETNSDEDEEDYEEDEEDGNEESEEEIESEARNEDEEDGDSDVPKEEQDFELVEHPKTD